MEVMSGIEAKRFMVDGIQAGGSEDGCSPIEQRVRRWGEIRTMPLFPPLGNPKYIEALENELIRQQELTVKIGKPTGNYGIKEVIFQNPTTIVFWTDGTKTVVNCMDNVEMKKKIVDGKEVTVKKPRFSPNFSKETGLAMAIAKKWAGNQGNYNDIFRKYIDEVE